MREYIDSGLSEEEAADKSIDRCISEGYLREYLLQRRGEAKLMLLHFDEKDLEESLKEEREEGREEGRNVTIIESLRKIMKNFKVSAEQAMDSLEIPAEDRQKYLTML